MVHIGAMHVAATILQPVIVTTPTRNNTACYSNNPPLSWVGVGCCGNNLFLTVYMCTVFELIVHINIKITEVLWYILIYEFASMYQKEYKLRVKIFSVKTKYKYRWTCKMYRNKAVMKTWQHCPVIEKQW